MGRKRKRGGRRRKRRRRRRRLKMLARKKSFLVMQLNKLSTRTNDTEQAGRAKCGGKDNAVRETAWQNATSCAFSVKLQKGAGTISTHQAHDVACGSRRL